MFGTCNTPWNIENFFEDFSTCCLDKNLRRRSGQLDFQCDDSGLTMEFDFNDPWGLWNGTKASEFPTALSSGNSSTKSVPESFRSSEDGVPSTESLSVLSLQPESDFCKQIWVSIKFVANPTAFASLATSTMAAQFLSLSLSAKLGKRKRGKSWSKH